MSHSASSDSSSPASTAPSTPPTESAPAYFLLTHDPSAAFLTSLPTQEGSGDRVFLMEGHGDLRALLEEAADILEDKLLLDKGNWDTVKTIDSGAEVTYYRTATFALTTSADTVVFDQLSVQTNRVCFTSPCLVSRINCVHSDPSRRP